MFKKLLPLLFLFAGFQANATLIDNGSTTVDTATNLEWLDVTATLGESYNSVIGGFGGYIADGYSVATTSQLCVLFGALGDSIANCPDANIVLDASTMDAWANTDWKVDLVGGWLVRDASVPEPAIIALFTLGLVGIGFARRKRQS
jgi:hypothetical protein